MQIQQVFLPISNGIGADEFVGRGDIGGNAEAVSWREMLG